MQITQEVLESRQFYLNQLPPVSEENQRHLERYKKFILSRPFRIKNSNEILEKHHILPKSFGENILDDNLILLSLREHFIAHIILYSCYNTREMNYALFRMSNYYKYDNVITLTSKQYEKVRGEFIKSMSGENSPNFGKNPLQNKTEEEMKLIKENISKRVSGENNPMYGRPWYYNSSEEDILRHNENIKNHWATLPEDELNQFKETMSKVTSGENNPMYGRSVFDAWKEKYPDTWEEHYNSWIISKQKAFSGENNPMYGKNAFENKTEEEMKVMAESKSKKMKEYWAKRREEKIKRSAQTIFDLL
jgi:hypothetical protein